MPRRYKTLTEAVVHTRRKSGKPVVSITDYWLKKIKPIDYKYSYFIPGIDGGKGRCPLHEDSTPSFGVVRGEDGVERFNCFGCRSFGHVVDLHRLISEKYFKQRLTQDEAAVALLNYFSIPIDGFRDLVIDSQGFKKREVSYQDRLHGRLQVARNTYTSRDLENQIQQGTANGQGVGYYNSLLYKSLMEGVKDG